MQHSDDVIQQLFTFIIGQRPFIFRVGNERHFLGPRGINEKMEVECSQ